MSTHEPEEPLKVHGDPLGDEAAKDTEPMEPEEADDEQRYDFPPDV